MRKLVVSSAAIVVLTAPATAYAGGGHGGGGGGGGGGGTPAFTLSVPASAAADQSGVQSVAVTITRVVGSATNLKNCSSTVSVTTTPNTDSSDGAVAGTDYSAPAATATIPKGQTFTTVTIPLLHETDNAQGADAIEAFNFTISSPTSSCKAKSSVVNPSAATDVITLSDGRTVVNVPDGDEVQFSAMSLGGCDSLSADLYLSTGDVVPLGSQADFSTCAGSINPADTSWTNSTGNDVLVKVGLTDFNCNFSDGVKYFSDTTSNVIGDTTVNHALVSHVTTNVWTVDIADSGGGCGPNYNLWNIPAAGTGNFSGTLQLVTSAPATPTNFGAAANGTNEIDLTWDQMPTAESYDIYRGASGSESFLTTTANNTYSDTDGITSGTEYCYYVVASNGVGASAPTGEQCATPPS